MIFNVRHHGYDIASLAIGKNLIDLFSASAVSFHGVYVLIFSAELNAIEL
jgi:hypothetical protein